MVPSTSTRTALALVVGILVGCLSLLAASPAESAEPPSPNLEELWEEYPLEPPATEPSVEAPVQPAPAQEPASPAPPPPAEGGTWSAWRLLLLGGVGGLTVLLVSGGLVARARRPRPTATIPSRPEAPEELIARARTLAKEAAGCDKVIHGQRDEGITVMSETADHDRSVASGTAPGASSYADIGERVAGVLTAAEAAASQILDDARAGAEDILDAARQDAEVVRGEAETYVADTRAAVESYASDQRREAEQAVQKQLTDSETQARATRQAAEAMAQQIEDAARQRGQALRDESRVVEERLKKVTVGLRRMTAEIEELLATSAGNGESLTDALRPYSQRNEAPASPGAASRADEL